MKVRKVRPIVWRLFHRKKRRTSDRALQRLLDVHLKMHREMINADHNTFIGEKSGIFTVDGQLYEAAVEKFQETMVAPYQIPSGPEDSFSTAGTIVHAAVSVIRSSKLPEFLLFLGVRIKG